MKQTNTDLIEGVFKEMLKYKPSLEKMLFLDDDEDDDAMDPRVLGDIIIKNLPWPIGVELRRLFSASMRDLDRMRLDQIFKTIERCMQFISFVLLCQLWKEMQNNKLELSEPFRNEFENRILVLSLGNYAWFIRSIGKLFKQNDITCFMSEMSDAMTKEFFTALDFWVPERNDIGHFQFNLTQEDIERRCVEYEEKLAYILKKIAFLAKYRLVSVREIKVIQPKNRTARFNHQINILNSSNSDFKAKDILEITYTDSNSILLMKSIKSIEEYLNLSPLIIDTYSEVIDNKEKFDIKKDVFLFTKVRADHLMYIGTEVTAKCDLRSLSNYDILLDQFKDMMTVITGKEFAY